MRVSRLVLAPILGGLFVAAAWTHPDGGGTVWAICWGVVAGLFVMVPTS